ncbi:MAG: aminopeptidase N [Acidisphaera sp.]|nr:aminopeptidase N [Acidisphaera sp.]
MPDSQRDSMAAIPAAPPAIRLADYRAPDFLIDSVDLIFELDPARTVVKSRLAARRNPDATDRSAPLRLDGEALELKAVRLDGAALGENRFMLDGKALVIPDLPDAFTLDVETRIAPAENTELSGLYVSGGSFFTQCEAEGFRRITFFLDRPDVMARYTTTVVADAARCPVLLSNGNPVDAGTTADGRHWAKFEDPHPKPCYLFALVAGDLIAVRDRFVRMSGRTVDLAIWVRSGDEDKCGHAMHALKASMAWDEQVFGREYDLDVFHIAAVSDFNMGAMENKGLNVFNTKYVLAKPETATDADYQGIETVISHEYFHNWTGNRITCRDWFQLSLKEGLTVFRDQEFTADQGSRAVKRIADVRRLRVSQFPEDAGPLAHPVRPASYAKIDNFYTATVYQKGAEVVRMMHTLLGPADFRRGMDLYFTRHDNQAVTIEDFARAMQDASGIDLSHFALWYSQAGTPELTVEDAYDPERHLYTLTVRQSTPPTPGQAEKQPFMIPLRMGLLGADGAELPTRLADETEGQHGSRVLVLRNAEERFVFSDVPEAPIASLLRGFSAPVKLRGVSPERLRSLAAHDTDAFVRWDSLQQYATGVLLDRVAARQGNAALDPGLIEALAATLAGAETDPAFAAEALTLPGESFLADQMEIVDVDGIHAAREQARAEIGRQLGAALRDCYARFDETGPYRPDGAAIGRRSLKNACLAYLSAAGDLAPARTQFESRRNMTDVLAALGLLAASDDAARQPALDAFYASWRHDDLVLDKWFAIQAMSPRPDTLARVQELSHHPDFDLRQPNRMRALVASYAMANPVRFHDASGAGYRFLADTIIALDPSNSQVAARLVPSLGTWRRYDAGRQAHMRGELERILAAPGLSPGTAEMASRSLAAPRSPG